MASIEVEPIAQTEPQLSQLSRNRSKAGIVRNIFASYVSNIVGYIAGFVATPLLLQHLGREQFGLWMLLVSVIVYVGLVELGISSAVSKRVAECAALDDKVRLKQVLGTAVVMYSVSALIAWLIVGAVTLRLNSLFQIPAVSLPLARLTMLVLGVYQTLKFVLAAQSAVLLGIGRMDIGANVSAIITLGATLLNVSLVLLHYGIFALACSLTLATLLTGIVTHRLMHQKLPGIVLNPRNASRPMVRELLKFGSRNATISLMGTVAYGSDMLILGRMLPVAVIANYAVAAKIVDLVNTLAMKPSGAMLPVFSDANARNDLERHFKIFTRSLSLCLIIALPFVTAICILGDYLIAVWVGAGHESSYLICAVLALMMFLRLPGTACYIIMTATERNRFLMQMYLIAAPTNLMLSIVLTRVYGAVGVALGSLITVAVVDFLILPIYVCRDFGFPYREYLGKSFAPLSLPCLVGVVLALAYRFAPLSHGRLMTVTALGIVTGTVWAIWLFTGISPEQRRAYLSKVRQRLPINI